MRGKHLKEKATKHRLADVIRKCGYTQRELAEKIGVDKTTMHLWVNGKRNISQDNLIKLTSVLNIPITDILSGEEPMTIIVEAKAQVVPVDRKPFYRVIANDMDITRCVTKDTDKMIKDMYGAD